ncbi:FKBP-type peptidyl-prolyl cis-trans isomerase [Chloropicon primus]|uniref:peptidylprolyl isomerase n=2 Tax=Chloropicon primus TaxID=1764295 RepID=A0A5B8MHU2_9CHLO|nr:FKBP-type peptidyl-prolyl cis-trans isomerase [Chloropicon primus]UPQ99230.1 FKBP-type peptidyl-prolyl cis-trans isomerase [Chloropicon primus]|eukprot:QDZ20019.1 FKBP-type peptidyl-prolyl cis-trans isomerase [Chloropicon primus]
MEGTSFYGVIVKPGRKTVFEPNKERSNKLHLSNATLGSSAREGERVRLKCRRADEGRNDIFLCSLIAGRNESCALDVIFDEYVEISVDGETEVHVTGYTVLFEEDSLSYYSDSDLDVGGTRMIRDQPESDSEEDLDEEGYTDSDSPYDSDELIELDSDVESDDYSSLSDGDEMDVETARALTKKESKEPDYIIEEITDEGKPQATPGKGGAKKAQGKNNKEGDEKATKRKGNKRTASSQSTQESPPKKVKVREDRGKKKEDASQKQSEAGPSSSSQKGGGAGTSQQPAKGKAAGKANSKAKESPASSSNGAQIQRFPSGLEIIKTAMGKADGKLATNGKRVFCRYVGRLKKTGQIFDKSKNKPFSFRLGVGEVIQGWDIGIKGMRVGDKRRITVPPKLGYGDRRQGPIPKNSTLVFDVELVDVR